MDRELKLHVIQFYGGWFAEALELTMEFEGGWSNHPSDRGGKTKYGVTEDTLAVYNDRSSSRLRIETLTRKQAADVYHLLFWRHMRIDILPGFLRGFMFDWSVHSGWFAIRSMQRHLKLKPDGIVGPRTRAALDAHIERTGETVLLRALAIRRMKLLCRLVRRDRTQGDFIVGWWDRVSHWLE